MTTIVSTVSNTHAVMLADAGITSNVMHPDMNKIVKQGTWLIGVCGEDRVCDVLQYAVTYPKVPQSLVGEKLEAWLPWIVTKVVPQVQRAVEQHLPKVSNGTLGDSGEALLITHGRAFLLGETLGITRAEPYWAVGSGSQLALGTLAAKRNAPDWNTKHAAYARDAIAAAELHDPYTRGEVSGYKSYPSGKIVAVKA